MGCRVARWKCGAVYTAPSGTAGSVAVHEGGLSTSANTMSRTATFNPSCVMVWNLRRTADAIRNGALHITYELNMASAYRKQKRRVHLLRLRGCMASTLE